MLLWLAGRILLIVRGRREYSEVFVIFGKSFCRIVGGVGGVQNCSRKVGVCTLYVGCVNESAL